MSAMNAKHEGALGKSAADIHEYGEDRAWESSNLGVCVCERERESS